MGIVQFEDIGLSIDVRTYGQMEKINDTLSKCRVRIFYKGLNRNRTFISDSFAEQLINSLPYAPVKGIFNYSEVDYEDHGEDNTDGRIYGIIPENPNFAWEKHLDEDGIEREYATADVYVFTGLYPEAKIVPGSSQSMEIFRETMKGEWRIHEDGKPCFYFTQGSLVGLQILGKNVEPCFEGAAFFSMVKELQDCFSYIDKTINKKEDEIKMDKSLFRLSDNEKAEAIFDALNPNFNEENGYAVNYLLMDVYDDYALCRNMETKQMVRAYYSKEEDNVSVGDIVDVKIVDVTATEYAALETMKAIGGTYEAAETAYNEATEKVATLEEASAQFEAEKETLNAQITEANEKYEALESEKNSKIEELETANSEFSTKLEELQAEKVRLENENSDIINENTALAEFKKNVEDNQKNAIIDEFSAHLTDAQIQSYKDTMDNYSVVDFKKEICTAAYEADPAIFSKNDGLIFKGDSTEGKAETGSIRILNKHINGGNK